MLILGLLGMYFDAAVVFVTKSSLFFRLAVAILCYMRYIFTLLSGSYDSSVFIWDIGGRKGTVFELNGHRNKVNTVHYVPSVKKLMSTGKNL